MIDRCLFCGDYEVRTGLLVRGREGAICQRCLCDILRVADARMLWQATPLYHKRLSCRARWRANRRWKSRGLPAFDLG